MVNIEAILDSLRSVSSNFDYRKLVPKGRMDKYTYAAAGIEMTWPWRKEDSGFAVGEGLGVGIGIGKYDFWFGWSRSSRES